MRHRAMKLCVNGLMPRRPQMRVPQCSVAHSSSTAAARCCCQLAAWGALTRMRRRAEAARERRHSLPCQLGAARARTGRVAARPARHGSLLRVRRLPVLIQRRHRRRCWSGPSQWHTPRAPDCRVSAEGGQDALAEEVARDENDPHHPRRSGHLWAVSFVSIVVERGMHR